MDNRSLLIFATLVSSFTFVYGLGSFAGNYPINSGSSGSPNGRVSLPNYHLERTSRVYPEDSAGAHIGFGNQGVVEGSVDLNKFTSKATEEPIKFTTRTTKLQSKFTTRTTKLVKFTTRTTTRQPFKTSSPRFVRTTTSRNFQYQHGRQPSNFQNNFNKKGTQKPQQYTTRNKQQLPVNQKNYRKQFLQDTETEKPENLDRHVFED